MHLIGILVVTFSLHCLSAHAQMTMGCFGMNTMQIRSVVMQAIENARAALVKQKQLNERMFQMGVDEAMNSSPYMPKTYHQHYASFSHQNLPASVQVDSGFIVQFATKEISQALGLGPDELENCPELVQSWHEMITPYCIRRDALCDPNAKYRSIDGACNNLANPLWGRSNRPHKRLLKPVYMDDIGVPRQMSVTGQPLPSARTISNVVHNQDPCCPTQERDLSLYVMQWGQNLDHDLTDTAIGRGANDATIICCNISRELLMQRSECFPISIEAGDERFDESCMNFVRAISGHDDKCNFGRRNQLNQASSYLDASTIYGHNDEDASKIRSFKDGLLHMTDDMLYPAGLENQAHCQLENMGEHCMKSGDFRIHVMPGLTAIQVMLLREHNRIAKAMKQMNPTLCDEDLYQEARKILIAEVQHITYAHWLPHVIGERLAMQMGLTPMPSGHNDVYDKTIDATVSNIFGVAPFRFGHTLLQNSVLFMKGQGMHIRNELAFNRPGMIFKDNAQGCAYVGIGLALHPSSKADGQIVDSIRNNLFLDNQGKSFDLISLNIQRSRDHGVPSYNMWRKYCGLPYVIHFGTGPGGLVHHSSENARKLSSVYRHPDDIDIFAGGMSETPVEGGVIGPVFSCIVGQQFYNLKYGDRFYYENDDPKTGFTLGQLNAIKKMTLAKLMCLHFHVPHIQMSPFRMPGPNNPMISCDMIEDLDISLWQQ